MPNLARTCVLALAAIFAASTLSAEAVQGVSCVQQQLNAAGHDAGPVDGIMGSKTSQALKSYASANDFSVTLPLTQTSAITYCTRLGQADQTLRAFWPSNDAPIIFRFADTVDEEIQLFIKDSFPAYLEQVLVDFPTDLPGKITLFIANDERALLSLTQKDSPDAARSFATRTKSDCGFRNQKVGAAVVLNYMYLCVKPALTAEDSGWKNHLLWRFSHEAVHIVQHQVAGSAMPRADDTQILQRRGPQWLVEGVASSYSNADVYGWTLAGLRQQRLDKGAAKTVPDLRDLESQRAVLSRTTDVYDTGIIASTLLIEQHGYTAVLSFWKQLALGQKWDTAFAIAFGTSPEQFYTEFDRSFRQSPR